MGDLRVRSANPESQEPDEVDEHGVVIRRCAIGSRALNPSQIAVIGRRQSVIQKGFDKETHAHCHTQLRLCLMGSGTKHKLAFGNDPRHINVPDAHPWLSIDVSHTLQRCDVTIFCS